MKNKGIDLEREEKVQSEEDWKFSAISKKCIALIPPEQRATYLPTGELQFGLEDFMDCASRGPLNILETKFNWLLTNHKLAPHNEQWLRDNGYLDENGSVSFSDRFIAVTSGTGRGGNSLKEPLQAIHENGLIPKKLLPASPDMTFDDYHDQSKITPQLIYLGQQFKSRFNINYDQVTEIDFKQALKDDMLIVALYAWPKLKDGIYKRVSNRENHAVDIFLGAYLAFDNYKDSDHDGEYIKKLASNYNFYKYGYRTFISENLVPLPIGQNVLLDILLRTLVALRDILKKMVGGIIKVVGSIIGK